MTKAHRARVSEANSGAVMVLCACGWISSVHVCDRSRQSSGGKWGKRRESATRDAMDEWNAHVNGSPYPVIDTGETVPPKPYELTQQMLDTVRAPGRFGRE